jgi:hypothetical protein
MRLRILKDLRRHRNPPRAEHARRPHPSRRQRSLAPRHLTHPTAAPPKITWPHQHA